MTSKLVHDYGVLGLVECPGDMLNKETQYLLVLLGRHTRSNRTHDIPRGSLSLSGQISPNFGQNASYQSGQNGTKMPRKPNQRSGQKCQKILQLVFQSGQISAWSKKFNGYGSHSRSSYHWSFQFLCLLDTKFSSNQALPYIDVTSQADIDMEHFKALKEGKNELISALKLSRKRGGGFKEYYKLLDLLYTLQIASIIFCNCFFEP